MRKETKIGIFVIITVALAIWGYKYLRGFNILASKTNLYAIYENVEGLRISTPVFVNGLQVGLVANFGQVENDLSKIKVAMTIDEGIKIPEDAKAEIVSSSLMGGTEIHLTFEGTCSGDDCAQDGDYIEGVTRGMLASIATKDEVSQYVAVLSEGLQNVLDTLNNRLSQSEEIQGSIHDVRATLANLKSTTDRLDRVMAGSSGTIQSSLDNVEAITANLKDNNEKIATILANTEALTNDLKSANVSDLAVEAKRFITQLQTTLASSDQAIKDLSKILQQLNAGGEGAIAMLLHDKEFAGNLQTTVKNLELLLQDIRLHPERYRRILSKKEMPYEPPEEDPGLKN